MKDADHYERLLRLKVIARQYSSGVTERSKEFFGTVRNKIGKPEIVYLIYIEEPHWDFFTYISDAERNTLCFDGFSWGYNGEGPRGLQWLFEQIGFTVDPKTLPSPHRAGCWCIQSDGLVAGPYHQIH